MRIVSLVVVLAALCLTSCVGDSPPAHDHEEGQPARADLVIPLNDGAKWEMDDHTRSLVEVMASRIDAGGEPKSIGADLQADLNQLIQGCTMTGKAHDSLHVFLESYMPAVRDLAESGSLEAQDLVSGLLQEFPNYFE